MPPRARVFPEVLIPKGVRQLFLTSFTVGAARTGVQRPVTSMAKITMAISRNTTDFNRRIKFAKKKTGDSQNAGGDGCKAARCSKRWALFWSTVFWSSKATPRVEPSILQVNSTVFLSGEIVGTPDSIFLGNKQAGAATNPCSIAFRNERGSEGCAVWIFWTEDRRLFERSFRLFEQKEPCPPTE